MLWLLIVGCTPSSEPVDLDHDGVLAEADCDDANAEVFPGAIEFCDGLDNDCDGRVDNDPVDLREWYLDADGDGFGVERVEVCDGPPGATRRGGDCDDTDANIFPGQVELCDGIDNDCDGDIDVDPPYVWFADDDGDGFGDPERSEATCAPRPGWVESADPPDCDDTNARINPNTIWYPDTDGDGFGIDDPIWQICEPLFATWSLIVGDCDDLEPTIFPGALELCDGIDQDCDGNADDPFAGFSSAPYLPLEITSDTPIERGLAVATVDLGSRAPAGADPTQVRVMVGSCENGLVELPARFMDRWSEVGLPGVEGDGEGVLLVGLDLDNDPTTADLFTGSLSARLYFETPEEGLARAQASVLENALVSLELQPDGRGTLRDNTGTLVFDQGVYFPGVDRISTSLSPAAGAVFVDAHPALSAVRFESTTPSAEGDLRWTTEWFMFAGRPEVWVHSRVVASTANTVFGLPDWVHGVRSFAADLSGSATQTEQIISYPGARVGLYDVTLPGLVQALPGGLSIPGVASADPELTSRLFSPGETLAESTVVIGTEPLYALESGPGGMRIRAQITLPLVP